jgi:hypothetical protein
VGIVEVGWSLRCFFFAILCFSAQSFEMATIESDDDLDELAQLLRIRARIVEAMRVSQARQGELRTAISKLEARQQDVSHDEQEDLEEESSG